MTSPALSTDTPPYPSQPFEDDYSVPYLADLYLLDGDMAPGNQQFHTSSPIDQFLSNQKSTNSPSASSQNQNRNKTDQLDDESLKSLQVLDLRLMNDWSPDSADMPPTNILQSSTDSSKRSRDNNNSDALLACWESPLCPNKNATGPFECKGECAPFLFDDIPTLEDEQPLVNPSEVEVEIHKPHSTNLKHKRATEDAPPRRTSRTSTLDSETSAPQKVADDDDDYKDKDEDNEAATPPIRPIRATSKPKGRVPHNQVEKKYRENVNGQLEALRRVVPLQNGLGGFDRLDIEDLAARKPSKAVVISSATAYIKQLQLENKRKDQEMAALKLQNEALQRLSNSAGCSLMKCISRLKVQDNY